MYKESFRDFKQRVSRNLSNKVSESGLSQRQQTFAGLDPRYVLRLKRGERNITLKTIWKLAQILDFDPSELFE